jgi:peptide/nickel transport system substrate-binding protein
VLVSLLVVACAGERIPPAGAPAAPASAPLAPKRLMLAISAEPEVLYPPIGSTPARGGGLLQDLIHPGLTATDNEDRPRALLIDAVPSVDNGLWRVRPDGHMETTWRIKPGTSWHDGTPLSVDDLLFTLRAIQDPDLPLRNRNYDLIDGTERVDDLTLVITWSRPFIDADRMFSFGLALPLPPHLLEPTYTANKSGFVTHPYWTDDYVGLGPYRLGRWVRGSHIELQAYPDYVLGRPRIDVVEARFFPDPNIGAATILAGAIDVWRAAGLSVDQGIELRDRWPGGSIYIELNSWVVIYPQFVKPASSILLDVEFRRALLHAIDRQEMVNSLMGGLVPIAHSPLNPQTAEYKATAPSIVRYPYDPARAGQLLAGLGFTRGPGGLLQDAAGQPLSVDVWGTANRDLHVTGLFPIVSYWRQAGVDAQPVVIPAQRATNLEEQATFPGFLFLRQDYGQVRMLAFHSSEARLPQRNFTGRNNGRYMNPDLDRLIDRYLATIPWSERMQVASGIIGHLTRELPALPLFYDMDISVASNRLQHAEPILGQRSQAWNAHEWDLTEAGGN